MPNPESPSTPKSAHLIIHAGQDSVAWCTCNRQGDIEASGHCRADEIETLPPAESVRVLVDGGKTTPMTLDLPPMGKHRLDQALVWAAEEYVAGPIEDEHVVAGPRNDAGQVQALAVARTCMDDWHQLFQSLAPDVLIPDALCLPWAPGSVSLAHAGDGVLMRWDAWSFGVFSLDVASMMLDQRQDCAMRWWGDESPPPAWADRFAIQPQSPTQAGVLGALKDRALSAPVNLLTGEWRTQRVSINRSQWRWVGGLAAGVAALALVSLAIEQQVLDHQANAVRDEVQARFAALFPNQPAMGRERELLARELAQLRFGQAAGLLELMARVQPVIQSNERLVVDALNYEAGQLELSLNADDVASLDRVVQQLKDMSLSASVSSATLSSSGAQGRVSIAMGGS